MSDGAAGILNGQVIVITGATRGIGREIALECGRRGGTVVVVGRTESAVPGSPLPGSVDDTVHELRALGATTLGIRADVSNADDTDQLIARTLAEFGRCDVLVNNAAFSSNGSMLEMPWHRWERAFRVQVVAPHQMCHGFLPGMRDRGEGRILNISTGASQKILPGLGLYSASKLAMERWSDYLDYELNDVETSGVAVNTLRVDRLVATEGWYYIAETRGIELATGGSPEAIPVTAESVADVAVWMIERPTSWSGNTVDFHDVLALGGPALVELEVADALAATRAR